MAKIFVESYGCSASFADSEMISGLILNGGHFAQPKTEEFYPKHPIETTPKNKIKTVRVVGS